MAIDVTALQELGAKLAAAISRLNDLIKSGAIQKDIDDQKAVIKEVYEQFDTVVNG